VESLSVDKSTQKAVHPIPRRGGVQSRFVFRKLRHGWVFINRQRRYSLAHLVTTTEMHFIQPASRCQVNLCGKPGPGCFPVVIRGVLGKIIQHIRICTPFAVYDSRQVGTVMQSKSANTLNLQNQSESLSPTGRYRRQEQAVIAVAQALLR